MGDPVTRGPVRLLLWAGPIALAVALALLLASAPFFRSGPGTPTAGAERAWDAMWGALAIMAVGALVGGIANVVWLVTALRAGRRPRPIDWIRLALGVLLAAGFLVVWFGA